MNRKHNKTVLALYLLSSVMEAMLHFKEKKGKCLIMLVFKDYSWAYNLHTDTCLRAVS